MVNNQRINYSKTKTTFNRVFSIMLVRGKKTICIYHMKIKFPLFILFLLLSAFSFAQEKKVIICTGSSSYAYHSHYCRGLNECRASIETITVTEAESLHRKPCGYCYKGNAFISQGKTLISSSSTNTGQCMALTKKGYRCSRKASANGYCWQHG